MTESTDATLQRWEHMGEQACAERARLAKLYAAAPMMLEALQELADLMDDVLSGDYTPDSFTTQPARKAIDAAMN